MRAVSHTCRVVHFNLRLRDASLLLRDYAIAICKPADNPSLSVPSSSPKLVVFRAIVCGAFVYIMWIVQYGRKQARTDRTTEPIIYAQLDFRTFCVRFPTFGGATTNRVPSVRSFVLFDCIPTEPHTMRDLPFCTARIYILCDCVYIDPAPIRRVAPTIYAVLRPSRDELYARCFA